MRTFHDPEVRAQLLSRGRRLCPDTQRRWGTLAVEEMLFHLNCQMKTALGELECQPVGNFLWHTLVKWLALYLIPWPKGANGPREMFPRQQPSFEIERARFARLAERLANKDIDEPWPPHPMFGPFTGKEWGRLTYLHFDHHFRQFGV